jgi:hypothetical protein
MLIKDHKIIFIHIPKCAGQSIERVFLEYLGLNWGNRSAVLLGANSDPLKGPPFLAHLTALEYKKFGYVSADEFRDATKFAFVRSPWTRLESEYRFLGTKLNCTFRTWVLKRFPRPGWDDHWRHVMPMKEYVIDESGNICIDYVGKFENINSDFEELRARLGLNLPPLQKTNSACPSQSLNWKLASIYRKCHRRIFHRPHGRISLSDCHDSLHDKETLDFVADFYSEDIEFFKYQRDFQKFKDAIIERS